MPDYKTRLIKEDGTAVNAGDLLEQIATKTGSGSSDPVTSNDITDATTVGKQLLTAPDAANARSDIGAGTSNLALGSTGTTAKPGNYVPAWTEVTSKPTAFAPVPATASVIGGVKQAVHVDPATGTVADVINALIAAGIMA